MSQSFKEQLLYTSLNESMARRAGSKWVAEDYQVVMEVMEAYKRISIIKRGADPIDGTGYGDLDDADIEYVRQHPYAINYPFIDKYLKTETPKEDVKTNRISKAATKGSE
jgi:hypothetical protein